MNRKAPTPVPKGAVKPEAPPMPPSKRFEPRICTVCSPAHADNCPECFGWGLTSKGGPISAGRRNDPPGGWKKCPVCGGEPAKEVSLVDSVLWVRECAEALVRASDPRLAARLGDPGFAGAMHALRMAVRSTVALVKQRRGAEMDETLDLDRRLR